MSAAGKALRILVADDNRDAADRLAVLLKWWGHEVRVAYDGISALQTARHFLPDVALLDFEMPWLNGGEVASRLRTVPGQAQLVVIATTATAIEDIRLAGYESVFDACLIKPYNLNRLEQLVADIPRGTEQLAYQIADQLMKVRENPTR